MTRGLDEVVMAQNFLCLLYPSSATRCCGIAAECQKSGELCADLQTAAPVRGRNPTRTKLERRDLTIGRSQKLGGYARPKCQASPQCQLNHSSACWPATSPRR